MRYPNLFSPYHNKRGFTFKNRLVSSPIGIWGFAPGSGTGSYLLEHFANVAKGGCSAVTMGDTPLNVKASPGGSSLVLCGEGKSNIYLTEFAKAVAEHGALASLQLTYMDIPEGGSVEDINLFDTVVNAYTEEKLQIMTAAYAEAAKTLKDSNLPMCMLHFAHGKLFDCWMSPTQNHRTDGHGGSVENRIKFPVAVVGAIREAVGEKFMIEIRITGVDPMTEPERFETHVAFINAVEDKIDLCHVSSQGDGFETFLNCFPSYLQELGMNVRFAAAMKKRVNVPVVAVGAITSAAMAEEILASGKADFVAMGRELLADPELPVKSMRGEEDDIRPCTGCHNCLMMMHSINYFACDINPCAGRGNRVPARYTAPVRRKVVIVGGGPSGMQAAITAHDCSHEVVLFEKSAELGGILRAFDDDPVKHRLKTYRDYLIRQVNKRGIDLRLNCLATPELVEAEDADTVIAAVGSRHIIPKIPGVDGKNVMTAIEAHSDGAKIGKKVVVIGGNLTGCEVALSCLKHGREPVVVEMTPEIHADSGMPLHLVIDRQLAEGVTVLKNAKCIAISETGVTIVTPEGERVIPADTVILAVGMESNYDLAESFRPCAPVFMNIGDSLNAGNLRNAIHTGFFAARDI